MIPRLPADPELRSQRKADLLLASELLRSQIVLATDDLGERADVWGRRWLWVKGWMADPRVQAVAGLGTAFFAFSGSNWRGKAWRGLRWAWMAWRMFHRQRR